MRSFSRPCLDLSTQDRPRTDLAQALGDPILAGHRQTHSTKRPASLSRTAHAVMPPLALGPLRL